MDYRPVNNYPVRYSLQKSFCDGDFGLKITEDGYSDTRGEYIASRSWTIPYTNELDYVYILIYCGTGENKQITEYKVDYGQISSKFLFGAAPEFQVRLD